MYLPELEGSEVVRADAHDSTYDWGLQRLDDGSFLILILLVIKVRNKDFKLNTTIYDVLKPHD